MDQYPKVVTFHPEPAADFVLVGFFEKNRAQDFAIFGVQLRQKGLHQLLSFSRNQADFAVQSPIRKMVGIVRNRWMPGGGAQQFHHHIDGDRVDISS
jgi:hypothetical protein